MENNENTHNLQTEIVFWGSRDPLHRQQPSVEECLQAVNPQNPDCPLSKFIGNERAVKKFSTIAFSALLKPNHLCRDLAIALFGPPSSGKTTLVRLFAETIQLPFIEFSAPAITSLEEFFNEIDRSLDMAGIPLLGAQRRNHFSLPPCVIFIDEIHALRSRIVNGLLKATEFNDGTLVTEKGRTVDCYNVCWIIATTDAGKLFDAFRSRFNAVELESQGRKEIAKIVHLANPDWSPEVCDLVAYYTGRIPRKALEFARYIRLSQKMTPDRAWTEIAAEVAKDEGIDEFGMHSGHLSILKALANGPIPAKRLAAYCGGRKIQDLEKYWLPGILSKSESQDPLVYVNSRGYALTEAGRLELQKRHIAFQVDDDE